MTTDQEILTRLQEIEKRMEKMETMPGKHKQHP